MGDDYRPIDLVGRSQLALFAISDQACPSAISEIYDYKLLLDSLSSAETVVAAILTGEDSLDATRRFDLMQLGLSDIKLESQQLTDILGSWQGQPLGAELAIVRLSDSMLTHRIPLFNAYTPLEFKREVLENVIGDEPSVNWHVARDVL